MDQIADADLKHVLILQLDDSSAIVMLSPALRALRETLPDAELTLMTSAAGSLIAIPIRNKSQTDLGRLKRQHIIVVT